jgi:hypothetical protein
METPPSPYPSNSNSKPAASQQRKAEKVVVGKVTSKPKTIGKRLREALIGGDSKSVLQYVITQVIVPQAKDMLAQATTQAIERYIFGESSSGYRRPSSRSYGSTYTNYSRYSDRGNRPLGKSVREERRPTNSLRTSHLDDLLFDSRDDAQNVLEQMADLLEDYDVVRVADLMTMIDKTSTHTDQKWGWESLQGTDVRTTRDGYLLILPPPISLD